MIDPTGLCFARMLAWSRELHTLLEHEPMELGEPIVIGGHVGVYVDGRRYHYRVCRHCHALVVIEER